MVAVVAASPAPEEPDDRLWQPPRAEAAMIDTRTRVDVGFIFFRGTVFLG
jgi:hypothetical protein